MFSFASWAERNLKQSWPKSNTGELSSEQAA